MKIAKYALKIFSLILFPLIGLQYMDWPPLLFVAYFWFELVVINIFTILRIMRSNAEPDKKKTVLKWAVMAFISHTLVFCGVVVFNDYSNVNESPVSRDFAMYIAGSGGVFSVLAAHKLETLASLFLLFVYHLSKFLFDDEVERSNELRLLIVCLRVFVFVLTFISAGFLFSMFESMGAPNLAFLVFVVVDMGFDRVRDA